MLSALKESRQAKFIKLVNGLGLQFPGAEIARKTGYEESTISTYLSGKRDASIKFLQRFCKDFGYDYDAEFSLKALTEPQPPAKAEKEMSLKDFLPTKSRFEELKKRSIEEALLGDILTRLAKVEIEIERLKQSH